MPVQRVSVSWPVGGKMKLFFSLLLATGYICCVYAENEKAAISADGDGNLVLTSVSDSLLKH